MTNQTLFALVIGIDTYPALEAAGRVAGGADAAGNDARAWSEALRGGGGAVRVCAQTPVSIPGATGATHADLVAGCRWLAAALADPHATGVLVYSGRSAGVDGALVVCPSDIAATLAGAPTCAALLEEGGFDADRLARLTVVLDTSPALSPPGGLPGRGLGGTGDAVEGVPHVYRASGSGEPAVEVPVGTTRRGAFSFALQAAMGGGWPPSADAIARCGDLLALLGVTQHPEGPGGAEPAGEVGGQGGIGSQLDGNTQGFKAYVLEAGTTTIANLVVIGLAVPGTAHANYQISAFSTPRECWKLSAFPGGTLPTTLKFREVANVEWSGLGGATHPALEAWIGSGGSERLIPRTVSTTPWHNTRLYKGTTPASEDYLVSIAIDGAGNLLKFRFHRASGTTGPILLPTDPSTQIDSGSNVGTAWRAYGGAEL